jgi:hypothetical protein
MDRARDPRVHGVVAGRSCHLGIHYGERTNEFMERQQRGPLARSGEPDASCRHLVAARAVERQHFSCGERCKVGALASGGCWGFWFSPRSNSSLGLRWLVVRLVGGQSIGCSQASGWGRAGEDAGRGSAVVPWKEPLAGHRLA